MILGRNGVARNYILVCLSDEPRPIRNRSGHVAAMDVVEGRIKQPRLLDIVNLKANVRGYPIPDPRSVECGGLFLSGKRRTWSVEWGLGRCPKPGRDVVSAVGMQRGTGGGQA